MGSFCKYSLLAREVSYRVTSEAVSFGFQLASFFRGHFFVSPYAAGRYAIFNWLCLVTARFHEHPFPFLHGA